MISDVLFHALEEINDWQRKLPQAYDGLHDEIEPVKAAMHRLRVLLDAPPGACPGSAPRLMDDERSCE